jgi:cysteine-rich repeat protein
LGYYNPNCSNTYCGDGIRVGLEECDDGKSLTGSGCVGCKCEKGWLSNGIGCFTECGDGLIVGAEECDDGNTL